MLIHPRKPLWTYGSSCKFGSLNLVSRSTTPIENLGFGRNHMADTMALYSHRASREVAVSVLLTVSSCRYFLQQNDAIRKGSVKGEIINLKILGIGNGLTVRRLECLAPDVLLRIRIRTRFPNTLATFNMLSRIHITRWLALQSSRRRLRRGRRGVAAGIRSIFHFPIDTVCIQSV